MPLKVKSVRSPRNVYRRMRNNPPFKNMWNCVGGKITLGETPWDAVIREDKEETGLTIQSVMSLAAFRLSWKMYSQRVCQ
ncbi:NUDIX domain-containing protein [Paenibacillus sp. TAF58]